MYQFKSDLERAVYEAFLTSALSMGDEYKNISWYGRNVRGAASVAA